MNLTSTQLTTLAAHIAANTNAITLIDGSGTFQANAVTRDPTQQQSLAAWYNALALSGDSQPFANLMCWNPVTTIQQLNTAIDWTTNPVGADQPTLSNAWLKWQTMLWNNYVDMSDPQVRAGVIQVWGQPSTTATNIGAATGVLCGKLAGRRIDLVIAPIPVQTTGLGAGAHVVPKGANGVPLLGYMNGPTFVAAQLLSGTDIDKALFPNG